MLASVQTIFIVGIKGAAMANLAIILAKMGKQVSGSDVADEFITDNELKENNISVVNSFSPDFLSQQVELVIYSAAHGGKNNPQVKVATKRGIKTLHQAEIIGELLTQFKTSVAVCGCHGKTTSSALLAYALKNLGEGPSYLVGTSGFVGMNGGDYAGKKYFVIEADEYGLNPPDDKTPKLEFLHPSHIICNNIDFDHPDVYKDLTEVKQTFRTFLQKTGKNLFLCADDPNIKEITHQLPRDSYKTFGFSDRADVEIRNLHSSQELSTFELTYGGITDRYTVSLFGEKNISNVAGVITFLLNEGFPTDAINQAIQGFTGAKRRFELVDKVHDSYLFDDYAHHPREIEATIAAVRQRFGPKRLVIIFQPHTYSRTESFRTEFVESLSKADEVFITPIFASARENPQEFTIKSVDLEHLAIQKNFHNLHGFNSMSDVISAVRSAVKKGDVIFTMGAGDIYKLKDTLISQLKRVYA